MTDAGYEIWVAGFPSLYGGADTELDHNIDLWLSRGVAVHLVPMFGNEESMTACVKKRGAFVHEFTPKIFKNKFVVSYCNGSFLNHLPDIMEAGKPRKIAWFNCMTYLFEKEIQAHAQGWIDFHGFVSSYQRSRLEPELAKIGPVQALEDYRPYFNPEHHNRFDFKYHDPAADGYFGVGRCSRDDGMKFAPDTWQIFNKVCSPHRVKAFVLGFGDKAAIQCGRPPTTLDWMTWLPNAIAVRDLYARLHCLIHKTGGSRESYCRIIPECFASGVPVVVENNYAFPELIENGVTGFMCDSSDEMSFRASELAFDEPRRKQMVEAARNTLINDIASEDRCWKAWQTALDA